MSDTRTLRLRADQNAPARARRFLEEIEPDIRPQLAGDLALLVSEAVTNAVRHGELRNSDLIDLAVTVSATSIRVAVTHPGIGPAPPDPIEAPDPASGNGGWGLVIIDRLADRWGVKGTGPSSLWFEVSPDRTPVK